MAVVDETSLFPSLSNLAMLENITEVQRDVEYRVTFKSGTSTIFLNITLPPQFPNERPLVKVAPPLVHPWVNDQMVVVGCPAINNFYMHSNLGKAITDVAKEFTDHPPQFLGTPASSPLFPASTSGYQPLNQYSFPGYQPMYTPQSSVPSSTPSLSSLSPPHSQYSPLAATSNMGAMPHLVGNSQITQTSPSRPPIPPRPTLPVKKVSPFPELENLSLEELKDLNDKPELMKLFVSRDESVMKLEAEKEETMKKNEEIARFNLSLKPILENSKDELLKKCERRSELKRDFDNNTKKQRELIQLLSIASIRQHLEIAASEAEEESEAIADEFLSKQITPEEFIQRFLEKRKVTNRGYGHLATNEKSSHKILEKECNKST
ncbi:unnamed protein product [Porites evermanni]|uniref:VPS37 C-terminal domain-containing protein n=1 Tax=Porites evermanni TaxID=104178 RepID=A0ABN8PNV8_9CNID|nr:unnamed protein product [Porites evermanni]